MVRISGLALNLASYWLSTICCIPLSRRAESSSGVCALHRNDGRPVQMPDEDVRAPFPCIGIGDSLYLRCMEDGCQKAVAEGLTEHVQADTGRQTVGKKPCKVFGIRIQEGLAEACALGACRLRENHSLNAEVKIFATSLLGMVRISLSEPCWLGLLLSSCGTLVRYPVKERVDQMLSRERFLHSGKKRRRAASVPPSSRASISWGSARV